jgi:hypothetical protein
VRYDGVQNFGTQYRARSRSVCGADEAVDYGSGDEEAQDLVVRSLDRHAQIVQKSRQHDDDLGILQSHAVILDDAGFDAAVDEEAQHLEGHVRDDLEVHGSVVGHAEPRNRVDIHRRP